MGKTIDIKTYIESVAYTKSEVDTALSGKAAASHTHDDRYYTEDEIDSKVSTINGSISDLDTELTTSNYRFLTHSFTYRCYIYVRGW